MDQLKLVTYCGLYCKLCAQCGRIPQQARALQDSMEREGYTFWGPEIPNFEAFWAFLGRLVDLEIACAGCRSGNCGYPSCKIRQCARERGVDLCPFCADYPCQHIRTLGEVYPILITDGLHMRQVGLDNWLTVQEDRAEAGFCYADIRIKR